MKKTLLLICLSLCLGLPVQAEVDIQTLCKEQREKVDEMVKVISTIQDQSIKDYLYQVWISYLLEGINKQSDNNEKSLSFEFLIYYSSGFTIYFKKVDERIQAYKKEYDQLLDWEKNETINPYEPFMIKDGESWSCNPNSYMSFYFSLPDKQNSKYTINNLRQYLQEYLDCTQVTKDGEHIKLTDKVAKFYDDNKLCDYGPQELANLIIEVKLEFERVTYYSANNDTWDSHFVYLWACSSNLWWGLHKNITLQEATKQIRTAVDALSPLKYNSMMVALNSELKQKGLSDTQANKEAEKKLNSIILVYANKLVEKARAGQNIQKKN